MSFFVLFGGLNGKWSWPETSIMINDWDRLLCLLLPTYYWSWSYHRIVTHFFNNLSRCVFSSHSNGNKNLCCVCYVYPSAITITFMTRTTGLQFKITPPEILIATNGESLCEFELDTQRFLYYKMCVGFLIHNFYSSYSYLLTCKIINRNPFCSKQNLTGRRFALKICFWKSLVTECQRSVLEEQSRKTNCYPCLLGLCSTVFLVMFNVKLFWIFLQIA